MDEYISKTKFEELMRKKSRNYFDLCYIDKIREHYNKAVGYSLAADEAHDFPTADVQIIKHGQWIISSDEYYYYCSECQYVPNGGLTNFCPNCGADMRGDDTNG